MKRATIFIPLALLILVAPGQDAVALDKPVVEVAFVLGDPHYRREFTSEGIAEIEQSVTELLVGHLSRRLDFLQFAVVGSDSSLAASNGDSTTRKILTFELNRQDKKDPNWFQEVGLHIQLAFGDHQLNHDKVFWKYRNKEFSDQVEAGEEEFILALDLAFDDADYKLLTANVLREISIAKGGKVVTEGDLLACIIPIRPNELCMDRESVIVLEVMIPLGLGSSTENFPANFKFPYNPSGTVSFPDFLGMMVTEIRENEHCDALRAADKSALQVQGIYIQEYILESICNGALSPQEAFAAGGGS